MDFTIQIPAKCILAGEHAIVNRGVAIVTPFKRYSLFLRYQKNDVSTIQTISGEGFNSLKVLLWPVVRAALEMVGEQPRNLKGFFDLNSSIPVGAGLGFSAALCTAVASWAVNYGLINKDELFEFAVKLEDLFHTKSSGVDIAGVMSDGLIQYTSDHHFSSIVLKWKPHLYISSSGEKSITERCTKKVSELRELDPERSVMIEERMISSAVHIKNALESNPTDGMVELIDALNAANECFYEWDLVSPKLNEHLNELRQHALAAKIVGAGYGGYVLSLWPDKPKPDLPFKLYSLF